MSRQIPHAIVVKSYFWPYSAVDIACCLTYFYGARITTQQVKDIWAGEARENPLLNQARPEGGFPATEKFKLAERLVA
jgi:hypothetical protein